MRDIVLDWVRYWNRSEFGIGTKLAGCLHHYYSGHMTSNRPPAPSPSTSDSLWKELMESILKPTSD